MRNIIDIFSILELKNLKLHLNTLKDYVQIKIHLKNINEYVVDHIIAKKIINVENERYHCYVNCNGYYEFLVK